MRLVRWVWLIWWGRSASRRATLLESIEEWRSAGKWFELASEAARNGFDPQVPLFEAHAAKCRAIALDRLLGLS